MVRRKDGRDEMEQVVRLRSGSFGKPFVHEGWLYLITVCGEEPDRTLVRLPLL